METEGSPSARDDGGVLCDDHVWKIQYMDYLRGPWRGPDIHSLDATEFMRLWSVQFEAEQGALSESEAQVSAAARKVHQASVDVCDRVGTRANTSQQIYAVNIPADDGSFTPLKRRHVRGTCVDELMRCDSDDIDAYWNDPDLQLLTQDDKMALERQFKEEDEVEETSRVERIEKELQADVELERRRCSLLRRKLSDVPVGIKARKGGVALHSMAIATSASSEQVVADDLREAATGVPDFVTLEDLDERDRQREAAAQRAVDEYVAPKVAEAQKDLAERVTELKHEAEVTRSFLDEFLEEPDDEPRTDDSSLTNVSGTKESATKRKRKKKKKRALRPEDISMPYEARERVLMHQAEIHCHWVAIEASRRKERAMTDVSKVEAEERDAMASTEARFYFALTQRHRQELKALVEEMEYARKKFSDGMTAILSGESHGRGRIDQDEETARVALMCDETSAAGAAAQAERERRLRDQRTQWNTLFSSVLEENSKMFETSREIKLQCNLPTEKGVDTDARQLVNSLLNRSRRDALRSQNLAREHWQQAQGVRPPSSLGRRQSSSLGVAGSGAASRSSPVPSAAAAATPSTDVDGSPEDECPSGISAADKSNVLTSKKVRRLISPTGTLVATLEGYVAVASLTNGCDGLTVLDCSGNKIRAVHKHVLSLSQLRELKLNDNALTSLPVPDAQTHTLRLLDVSMNQLIDLDACEMMPKLTTLLAVRNKLSDLRPLSNAEGLTKLDLYRNDVSSILDLAPLRSLVYLNIGRNSVQRLDPIGNFPLLVELTAYHNDVQDVPEQIRNCVLLQQLFLEGNKIPRLSPAAQSMAHTMFLPLLTVVNLTSNRLTDIRPLSMCLLLETVDVSFNLIEDLHNVVEAVWPLRRLRSLNIADNPVCRDANAAARLRYVLVSVLPSLQEYNSEGLERSLDEFMKGCRPSHARVMWHLQRSGPMFGIFSLPSDRSPHLRRIDGWAHEAEYDFFNLRQYRTRINAADPIPTLMKLYGEQKVYHAGIGVGTLRDGTAYYRIRIDAFDKAAKRRKVFAWLRRQIHRAKYEKAVLRIQPRWKGAVVRLRMQRLRGTTHDDLDIDGFGHVTLDDKYMTMPESGISQDTYELMAQALAAHSAPIMDINFPTYPRPAIPPKQHDVVPPAQPSPQQYVQQRQHESSKMTAVATGVNSYNVRVDAWVSEQSNPMRAGVAMAPQKQQQEQQPNAPDANEEEGWGTAAELFRKRNKNMMRQKREKVIKQNLSDPLRRLEQFRKETTKPQAEVRSTRGYNVMGLRPGVRVPMSRTVLGGDGDWELQSVSSKGTVGNSKK